MRPNTEQLTSAFRISIDAGLEAAHDALQAIDPIASLTQRLSALGVDDRAVWVESPAAAGPTDTGGEPDFGFSLLWRFGPPAETAQISWRIRLSEDGVARTLLSILLSAQASNRDADTRLMMSWPMIETIALAHARGLRRAVDEYTDDPYESKQRPRLALVNPQDEVRRVAGFGRGE